MRNYSWKNANATTGEPITENSVPNLDDWGWDDYWTCVDWIEWHKIMKEKKGKEFAKTKFLEHWNKQGMGAHAISCRSPDTAFRDYFKKEGIADDLFAGIGIIAKPIGAGTDVLNSGLNAVSDAGKAIENTVKVLKIAIPIAVGLTLIIGGLHFYKKYAT